MFVEMNIAGLAIDSATNMPMVLLVDKMNQTTLPIWIGVFEASAIATELENIQVERPMTHDLLKNILLGLGANLRSVEIHDLKENTFYSNLVIVKGDHQETRIDARPSDAIAVALRCKAPILVDEKIVEVSGRKNSSGQIQKTARTKEEWSELLKGLSDDAFGKYKM